MNSGAGDVAFVRASTITQMTNNATAGIAPGVGNLKHLVNVMFSMKRNYRFKFSLKLT